MHAYHVSFVGSYVSPINQTVNLKIRCVKDIIVSFLKKKEKKKRCGCAT
jgi:hypothetical protein